MKSKKYVLSNGRLVITSCLLTLSEVQTTKVNYVKKIAPKTIDSLYQLLTAPDFQDLDTLYHQGYLGGFDVNTIMFYGNNNFKKIEIQDVPISQVDAIIDIVNEQINEKELKIRRVVQPTKY